MLTVLIVNNHITNNIEMWINKTAPVVKHTLVYSSLFLNTELCSLKASHSVFAVFSCLNFSQNLHFLNLR